ncbi:MAG: hypothetical protein V5A47_10000 [Bacteroidales bacterium]
MAEECKGHWVVRKGLRFEEEVGKGQNQLANPIASFSVWGDIYLDFSLKSYLIMFNYDP